MTKLVSKCGIDCGVCPWGPYPRKNMTAQEFESYRNNAKAVLGYMPIRTPCATCQTPNEKIRKGSKLPNRNCLIRQCVDKSGVANCAYCSRFPCDTLKATASAWNRKTIEEKLGAPLSEGDYRAFVEPFEGTSRLQKINASLTPKEIMEPARIPVIEKKIVGFPEKLPFSEEEIKAFKAVHRLLSALHCSSLGFRDADAFGQHHELENLRTHVLRYLWILGSHGKLEKEIGSPLVIDGKTFLANRGSEKTLAIWSFLKDTLFKALSEFGISSERIALEGVKEEDLVTGTNYLRSAGWVIQISFDKKTGASDALKALSTYAHRLDDRYGKKAFRYFQEADMRCLTKHNTAH